MMRELKANTLIYILIFKILERAENVNYQQKPGFSKTNTITKIWNLNILI